MDSESPKQKPDPEIEPAVVGESPETEFVAELLPSSEISHGIAEAAPAMNAGVAYNPSVLVPPPPQTESIVSMPSPMANLAAKGGAVGSLVLGVLAFVGSFISSYAIINSGLGIALGLWGLKSNHRRLATVGLLLCTVSAFFCVVEISSWLQSVWPADEI